MNCTFPDFRPLSLLALLWFAMPLGVPEVGAADFGPRFKVQSVPVDGGTVSVAVGGSGPAGVLLHGHAGTSPMWEPPAAVLAPRFPVIAPPLPGIRHAASAVH